jgi:hypothetical protein
LADESVQVLKEAYERMQANLMLWPGPCKGNDPLFATTACFDRGGERGHRPHLFPVLRLTPSVLPMQHPIDRRVSLCDRFSFALTVSFLIQSCIQFNPGI